MRAKIHTIAEAVTVDVVPSAVGVNTQRKASLYVRDTRDGSRQSRRIMAAGHNFT